MKYPVSPIRRIAQVVNGGTPTPEPENWDGDVPWATPVDLGGAHGRDLGETARTISERGLATGSALVPPGSVVLSTRAPVGYVAQTTSAMAFNQGCRGLVPTSSTHPRFLAYALISAVSEMNSLATGTTFQELSSSSLASLRVPSPDLADQRLIANFLDRETAHIDAMIDAQQRLLNRLAERRTAILDGLVQRVVGTHSTIRLKFAAQVTVGIVVTPSLWYADEGVPALRGVNVRPEQIDLAELVRLNEEGDHLHAKSRLRTGDVVVVRTGQAGSAAVITPELDGANAIDLLIIRPGQQVTGGYLAAVINSNFVRGQIASASVGAIQSHFNVEALASLQLPVMPPQEQLVFLNEWRASRGRVDGMITRTDESIGLMRERRAALITAAVTGRLDPRTGVERLDEVLERAAS